MHLGLAGLAGDVAVVAGAHRLVGDQRADIAMEQRRLQRLLLGAGHLALHRGVLVQPLPVRHLRHRRAVDQLVEQRRKQVLRRHVAVFGGQALDRLLHVAQVDFGAVHPGHDRVGGRLRGGRDGQAAQRRQCGERSDLGDVPHGVVPFRSGGRYGRNGLARQPGGRNGRGASAPGRPARLVDRARDGSYLTALPNRRREGGQLSGVAADRGEPPRPLMAVSAPEGLSCSPASPALSSAHRTTVRSRRTSAGCRKSTLSSRPCRRSPTRRCAAKTDEFRARLAAGATLDDLLPEAFAVVREAARRTLGMRHFDVQLIGGMVLHEGKIAEMKTGEGKTLVATLAVYLNALRGKGVHVVTVNDYLARRDAEWMGQIYGFLGMTVGVIVHGLDDAERRAPTRPTSPTAPTTSSASTICATT